MYSWIDSRVSRSSLSLSSSIDEEPRCRKCANGMRNTAEWAKKHFGFGYVVTAFVYSLISSIMHRASSAFPSLRIFIRINPFIKFHFTSWLHIRSPDRLAPCACSSIVQAPTIASTYEHHVWVRVSTTPTTRSVSNGILIYCVACICVRDGTRKTPISSHLNGIPKKSKWHH